ncbi:MAG: ornithine carbamoyltransferase [bacterium]
MGFRRGKSLLKLDDLSHDELFRMLRLAVELKLRKRSGMRGDFLARRSVALIFEKSSTRTRCAFTVAAFDEGGMTEYLDINDIHIGRKETIADTARVLGRLFDGIAFRGFQQSVVDDLSRYAGVPVWNALTDDWHPTQALADLMTIDEHFGRLAGLKFVYIGDGRNNVVNTLMVGCAMAGIHMVNCCPAELAPDPDLLRYTQNMARMSCGSVTVCHDPMQAVKGANIVYTDVWVSMGEEAKTAERLILLKPYQVNMELMRGTGQLGHGQAIFLHCLPAFHNSDTVATRESGPLEVTDEVFEASFSKVFDQAENRLHTIKAVMVASLA